MTQLETGVAGGVSFALTAEQRELRALAREFAQKEIRPKAAEYDVHATHPADVIAKAHELGLMNLHIPESLGGAELPAFDGMLVGEELNWGCSGSRPRSSRTASGQAQFSWPDPTSRRRRGCRHFWRSRSSARSPLSEPDAGSDVARMKTTAERRGDEYVLNGSKTFITNAGHATWAVVFAKTDPTKGHRGISAFVVPMDAQGVHIEKHLDKMGQRSTDTSAFALTDVAVPAANRLGEEGEGFKIAMRTLDFTRPGTAAGAVGVAQAAYELAVEYAKERVTFDVPIAMHQGVNFMIADMATEIEAARLLVWQSAWLHDQGERATLQSSFAKRFAADTAMKVTTDAVQVFGGYGYIKEYPVEKLMRDAKLFQIYEGTSQIQRLVIAKEIFLPRGLATRVSDDGARDRPVRTRRACHRRLARARPGRRPYARACRRRRRDRRHPRRVGALGGDRQLGRARDRSPTQGLVHTEETVAEIESLGRRGLALRCDVTNRDQVGAAVARTVDELGSVDILVNNAGTLDHVGQFHDQRPELWERDLRVNLTGGFNCAQAVWPHMKERGWGRIVNMASVAGRWGASGRPATRRRKQGSSASRRPWRWRAGGTGSRATRSCRGSSARRRSTWRTRQ